MALACQDASGVLGVMVPGTKINTNNISACKLWTMYNNYYNIVTIVLLSNQAELICCCMVG